MPAWVEGWALNARTILAEAPPLTFQKAKTMHWPSSKWGPRMDEAKIAEIVEVFRLDDNAAAALSKLLSELPCCQPSGILQQTYLNPRTKLADNSSIAAPTIHTSCLCRSVSHTRPAELYLVDDHL